MNWNQSKEDSLWITNLVFLGLGIIMFSVHGIIGLQESSIITVIPSLLGVLGCILTVFNMNYIDSSTPKNIETVVKEVEYMQDTPESVMRAMFPKIDEPCWKISPNGDVRELIVRSVRIHSTGIVLVTNREEHTLSLDYYLNNSKFFRALGKPFEEEDEKRIKVVKLNVFGQDKDRSEILEDNVFVWEKEAVAEIQKARIHAAMEKSLENYKIKLEEVAHYESK